jgi:hypothetical protein
LLLFDVSVATTGSAADHWSPARSFGHGPSALVADVSDPLTPWERRSRLLVPGGRFALEPGAAPISVAAATRLPWGATPRRHGTLPAEAPTIVVRAPAWDVSQFVPVVADAAFE